MELKEIIEKCKTLNIYEERFVADDYYEIVFYTRDSDQWIKLFTEILGSTVKPAGAAPNKEDIKITQKYGGLRNIQTLFKKQVGNTIILAMFWPWQDEVRTTLKLVLAQTDHYEELPE